MIDPVFASVAALQSAMEKREISAVELALCFMERAARLDSAEGGLNAVRLFCPDALAEAEQRDRERAAHAVRSPLHGIPVLLKDNIDVASLPTTGGSLALRDSIPQRDAELVRRLREAGAVIFGKTNLSEMAHYMASDAPSGYSAVAGQVLCPYDRAVNPSGSSTGSAVAVAAGLCPVAVGTETCGSILSPASVNGVAGLKPTLGLVSRSGILPISGTLDTAGPLARTAADAALLLSALAGRDPRDAATAGTPEHCAFDTAGASLRGVRIGVTRDYAEETTEERRAAGELVLLALREAGAELVELPFFRVEGGVSDLMRHEMRAAVNSYLDALGPGAPVRTLEGLIARNREIGDAALRYGQDLLEDVQEHGSLAAPDYIASVAGRQRTRARLRALMDGQRVEVVFSVAPRTLPPFTGFPAMSVPVGTDARGLPIGSCFFARPFADNALLRVCAAVQEILPPLAPPIL